MSLPHILVVGAGAFGGWSALSLLRRGARVTLIDAWGPGNSRASSGGETRVIRATYGPYAQYVDMVRRSLELWRSSQKLWGIQVLYETGHLWMAKADDRYVSESAPLLTNAGLTIDELSPRDAATRFPQIDFTGIRRAWLEKHAGLLRARDACQAVLDTFVAEGGEYVVGAVEPVDVSTAVKGIRLQDGRVLVADQYLFACGPWTPSVIPGVIGGLIRASRQELHFFGVPAGDTRFNAGVMPTWLELDDRINYGIPAFGGRGFKVGDDERGPPFDPTTGERVASPENIQVARATLARRFPALANAPLLESRVCQYENSADGHLILDRLPAAPNACLAAGGSGHGFKLGPAVGEIMARVVLDDVRADPMFRVGRFAAPAASAAVASEDGAASVPDSLGSIRTDWSQPGGAIRQP